MSLQVFSREELLVALTAHELLVHGAFDTPGAGMDLQVVDEVILEHYLITKIQSNEKCYNFIWVYMVALFDITKAPPIESWLS